MDTDQSAHPSLLSTQDATSPEFIRQQCHALLTLAQRNQLDHWRLNIENMSKVADYVAIEIRRNYPDLQIPWLSRRHHINAGGIDRMQHLRLAVKSKGQVEFARVDTELIIISVLLDASAGQNWRYHESASGKIFSRSEGLAVASFDLYSTGFFSSRKERPLMVDAGGLKRITASHLNHVLQASTHNPIIGLSGRALLLNHLGHLLASDTDTFGDERLGCVFDTLINRVADKGYISARNIFLFIQKTFLPLWVAQSSQSAHAKTSGQGGDTWEHPLLANVSPHNSAVVPLHQTTLWMTYSLLPIMRDHGLAVEDVEALPAFPDYRNGGLFIDMGVLEPRNPELLSQRHLRMTDLATIEWRALTVALLDELAVAVAEKLSLSQDALTIPQLLQGGSWSAGRRVAQERRSDGNPPIKLISDGTML